MATRQVHLTKGPQGMAAMTACGRNILRTPMSAGFDEFQRAGTYRCVKCAASKTAALFARKLKEKEFV